MIVDPVAFALYVVVTLLCGVVVGGLWTCTAAFRHMRKAAERLRYRTASFLARFPRCRVCRKVHVRDCAGVLVPGPQCEWPQLAHHWQTKPACSPLPADRDPFLPFSD